MLSRRTFVKLAALPLLAPAGVYARHRVSAESGQPPDSAPVIKSFSVFKATGNFNRFIGMNSYDKAPKGINGSRGIVKMTLADGTVGIGPIGYRAADEPALLKLKELIGQDPFDFYSWHANKITGVKESMKPYFFDARYSWFESAVLDAVGKIKRLPVWKLTGESVREGVDPYDGSLYFEDIANNRNVDIIGEVAKKIRADGYRAIKMKLGRPSKWLPGEAGVQRDIDAFIAAREAVGSNFILMADANNGYAKQMDWSIRLLKACAPYKMFFIEELFPDDAAEYGKLRDELLRDNFFVPIAEGENVNDLSLFDAYMTNGIYNYLQPDMHTCGYSNILAMARKAQSFSQVNVIPHVWQSQLGLLMSLHISKIQRNITFVEDSRYTEHAIIPGGYLFREGQWFIPDKPGWGIELSPDYKQFMVDKEIVIS